MRGGIVQGIGNVLFERVVYDAADGQFLTTTFMDYLLPARSRCRRSNASISNRRPKKSLPVDHRGVGEGGAVGAPAALTNAMETRSHRSQSPSPTSTSRRRRASRIDRHDLRRSAIGSTFPPVVLLGRAGSTRERSTQPGAGPNTTARSSRSHPRGKRFGASAKARRSASRSPRSTVSGGYASARAR